MLLAGTIALAIFGGAAFANQKRRKPGETTPEENKAARDRADRLIEALNHRSPPPGDYR